LLNTVSGLHSTTTPGILAVDVSPQDGHLLVTAGADKTALIYDKGQDKTTATLKSHTKKILDVAWSPKSNFVLTASADKTVKAWGVKDSGKWGVEHTLKTHSADVTAVSFHPSGEYFLSCSEDGTWALNDVVSGGSYFQNKSKTYAVFYKYFLKNCSIFQTSFSSLIYNYF
jgi:WD40 repeat protein